MNFILTSIFSFISAFFVPTTYYVTPNGSGTGTGLDSANTVSYAGVLGKNLSSGDVVLFKGGNTYAGQFNFPRDGVTYGRYSSGTNPVMSGFTNLTWTLSSGNVYYATLNVPQANMQGLSVDGSLRAMGRYPNTGYLTYTSHSANTSITGTTVGALPNSFVGGEVVIKKFRYILDRHIITSRSANTLVFTSTNFYGNSSNDTPTDNNGFFVQNHPATLDQDGEWYYTNSEQRVYGYFTSNPNGRNIKASTVNVLVPLNSSANITFNNLDFEGGNTGAENNATTNIKFNNCNFRQQATGIYAVDYNNIEINGGTFKEFTNSAITGDGGGTGMTIDGVLVDKVALLPGMGKSGDGKYNGIAVYGHNTIVRNSIVKNTGFNGISLIGNHILIEKNFVDSTCSVKDDGANIYYFTSPNTVSEDVIIRNNITTNPIGAPEGAFWNEDPKGEAAGIYLDGMANHVIVTNNVVANSTWGGIFVNANHTNQILNNLVYNCFYGMLITDVNPTGYGAAENLVVTGNRFVARSTDQKPMYLSFDNNNPDNPIDIGLFDNNVYSRPIDNNLVITISRPNSGFIQNMTLATWKSQYSQDPNSSVSPLTTNSLSNLRFDYNYSSITKTLTLPGIYNGLANEVYTGSIGIPAYGGAVTAFTSALPPVDPGTTPRGFYIIKGVNLKPTQIP